MLDLLMNATLLDLLMLCAALGLAVFTVVVSFGLGLMFVLRLQQGASESQYRRLRNLSENAKTPA